MDRIFGKRLDELIAGYIKNENRKIDLENKRIEEDNKETMQKFKQQIQRTTDKPVLREKIKKYSQQRLMDDINDKYDTKLTRQKLYQYTTGEHMPPDGIIKAFCRFLHASCDYLFGISDIKSPSAARVQDFIKLNDTAIHTLMDIQDDTMLTVLNALLSDAQSLGHVLLNVYEQAYSSYEQKHRPDRHGDYDVSAIHSEMEYAISLNRFITDRLMPFVREDFDKRLREELDYEEWRSNNREEYERTKVPDMPQADSEVAVTVTILPKKEQDS